jgi:hypothetical protein
MRGRLIFCWLTGIDLRDIQVRLPPADVPPDTGRMSRDAFLEQLARLKKPGVAEAATWILDNALKHQLRVFWGKASFTLCYDDEASGCFTFGHINREGEIPIYALYDRCDRLGLPDSIWRGYYNDVISLVPGARIAEFPRKAGKPYQQIIVGRDKNPSLEDLGTRREEWFAAIDRSVARIAEATSQK